MNWYYSEAGEARGPFTEEKLSELARSGVISTETLIWQPVMEEWKPVIIALPAAIQQEVRKAEVVFPPVAAKEQPKANPFAMEPQPAVKRPGFFQRLFGWRQKT